MTWNDRTFLDDLAAEARDVRNRSVASVYDNWPSEADVADDDDPRGHGSVTVVAAGQAVSS